MPSPPTIPELFLASALTAVALVGIIIFFVVIYQRRLLRQQAHVQAIEARQQQQMLLASVSSQEAERQRIARDLHDEVGNTLSTIKMHLNTLKRRAGDQAAVEELVVQAQEMLIESIQTVRQLSHTLLPPTLERLGLVAALEELSQRVSTPRVTFVYEGSPPQMTATEELGIYRIMQEALTNTLKHAEAKAVNINIWPGKDQIRFTYQDDGKGFQEEKLQDPGMGLSNMQSRAQVIGARLSIESAPAAGMAIQIVLPRQSEDSSHHS